MTVVDATSFRPADVAPERLRDVQEWALTRASAAEQSAAIALVLTHDFDEPHPESASRDAGAESLRERYLVEMTGIVVREHTSESVAVLRTEPEASAPSRLAA